MRAILDGHKTQTRRVLKTRYMPPPDATHATKNGYASWCYHVPGLARHVALAGATCPYGDVGDRLWVRERWHPGDFEGHYCYAADKDERNPEGPGCTKPDAKWRPSIHMPRAACRLVLEITDVRLHRLQETTVNDAWAEGTWTQYPYNDFGEIETSSGAHAVVALAKEAPGDVVDLFRISWDKINAKRGYGWDANPWVWAITFRSVPA